MPARPATRASPGARRARGSRALALVAALSAGLAPGLGGCGRAPAPTGPSAGAELRGVVGSPGRVRDVVVSGRPLLRLVERSGDPAGAVAVAVFPPSGSAGALALAALLEVRLARAGVRGVRLAPSALGLVASGEAEDPARALTLLRALEAALREPAERDVEAAARARSLLGELAARSGEPTALGACVGALGAEGRDALLASPSLDGPRLEALREGAVTARRVAFTALGERPLLRTVEGLGGARWPLGAPLDDAWPLLDEISVLEGPAPELRVALRLGDPIAALGAARELGRADHPAWARLGALGTGVSPGAVDVTLRPRGACLVATLSLPPGGLPTALEGPSRALLALGSELRRAARRGAAEDDPARALLAPESATDAAALAAWTAVRSEEEPSAPRVLAELRAPAAVLPATRALREAVEAARSARRELHFAGRVERGQAEEWLLVASPCGARGEPAAEAGLRALTVASLAAAYDGQSQVRVEPWLDAERVGLVAHAPALPGESPEQHAERVARALARALRGEPLDGRVVAAARSRALAELGAERAREELVRLLGGAAPGALEPRGSEASLASLGVTEVERARAELAAGPLEAALLASEHGAELDAAQGALEDWLAPAQAERQPCRVPAAAAPASPGVYRLRSPEAGSPGEAVIGVPLEASREAGSALAYLLGRPGGLLERALGGVELAGAAEAEWLGGAGRGVLLVHLHAEERALDAAVGRARALLDELSRGALGEREVEAAASRQAELEATLRRSPRGRVVELLVGRPPRLDAGGLGAAAAGLCAPSHRVVRVAVLPR